MTTGARSFSRHSRSGASASSRGAGSAVTGTVAAERLMLSPNVRGVRTMVRRGRAEFALSPCGNEGDCWGGGGAGRSIPTARSIEYDGALGV